MHFLRQIFTCKTSMHIINKHWYLMTFLYCLRSIAMTACSMLPTCSMLPACFESSIAFGQHYFRTLTWKSQDNDHNKVKSNKIRIISTRITTCTNHFLEKFNQEVFSEHVQMTSWNAGYRSARGQPLSEVSFLPKQTWWHHGFALPKQRKSHHLRRFILCIV